MTEENFVPPRAPKELCFNELDFIQKVFDTDTFLQDHRKDVSLERMRDDLGVYLKILRSAMIELINKDYADFVNLSSNLIGLDKAINNLETPLGQLREEVMQVRQCLDDTINEMTDNLNKHKEIRERRQSIHSLIRYHKSISKLCNILSSCDIKEVNLNLKPEVLERAATELNQLKFHTNRCKLDLTKEQASKVNELDEKVKTKLNSLFVAYITKKESLSLVRCLRIYVSLDKVTDAEEVVRKKIVVPAVENIISDHCFQNDPQGLKGTYQKLEKVLDSVLKEILSLTLNPDRVLVKGFNFLVNSYWPEVEQRIEDYLPIIFAPGNPELFHKRYTETLDFLLSLERRCFTMESINCLKSHPQYVRFLKKWNLPVYFQIRFQEIAGTAESILSAKVSSVSIRKSKASFSPDEFTLHATCIIWDCLLRIWAKEVYLPQLLHRFWKLCLQLCSRYHEWCQNSLKQAWPAVTVLNETSHNTETDNSQRLEFLVGLYTDIEKLSRKMSSFLNTINDKVSMLLPNVLDLLNDSIKETTKTLDNCLPLVTQEIVNELLQHSATHLRQISDIPRLFRRTNREVPTKPCPYVKRALDFLTAFHADYKKIIPLTVSQWLVLALTSLTQQYMSSVKDVLTSVQKTEESLRRLKKIRDKSAGVSTTENQGTGDDEKIRIQLLIDVQSYIDMIKELDVKQEDIENLKSLLEVVESATKTKTDNK